MEIMDNTRLRQHYQQARTLAIGLVASLPLYVVGGEVVAAGQGSSFHGFVPDLPVQLVRGVAVVCGLLLLFSANVVRRKLLEGDASLSLMVTQAMVPQERYATMLKGTVVVLALCDALGLLGLTTFLLCGQRLDLYAFAVAGVIAAWFHFPRLQQWQRWYTQRSRIR